MTDKAESYDSTQDTKNHIEEVRLRLDLVIKHLVVRKVWHDASKLESPEKELFDKYTPLLRDTTYGSPEYQNFLIEMRVGLDHHYKNNPHHPEYYPAGIDGMTLIDIIEMFCDWKAASTRHADGNFEDSLTKNKDRFAISDQLHNIFENTRKAFDW